MNLYVSQEYFPVSKVKELVRKWYSALRFLNLRHSPSFHRASKLNRFKYYLLKITFIFSNCDTTGRQIFESTFEEIRPLFLRKIFEKLLLVISLFLNILLLKKYSNGWSKARSVSFQFGEYAGCRRTFHRNDLIFSV